LDWDFWDFLSQISEFLSQSWVRTNAYAFFQRFANILENKSTLVLSIGVDMLMLFKQNYTNKSMPKPETNGARNKSIQTESIKPIELLWSRLSMETCFGTLLP
jgi:hypothetical protein